VTPDEFERSLDKAFSDRFRLVAENPHGQFSSAWMFWGNNSDFYFSAKIISDRIKVSLHENGRGYVAYDKPYFEKKRASRPAAPPASRPLCVPAAGPVRLPPPPPAAPAPESTLEADRFSRRSLRHASNGRCQNLPFRERCTLRH
jgi:hypothetical protein